MTKTSASAADFRSRPVAIFFAAALFFIAAGAVYRLQHPGKFFFQGERFVDGMLVCLTPLAIAVRLFQTYKARHGIAR